MKRRCTIHAFLVAVLVSTLDVQIVNGQGNSYLGLWGNVFDGSASKKNVATPTGGHHFPPPPRLADLKDRLHQAAGEWRAEADEVRSRLIQRIGGGGGNTAATGEEKETASSFLSETFSQLFGGAASDNKDSPVTTASDTAVSTTETLGLLDRMQERLGLDGKIDARQLAALAAVQGLALASLRKHLAASQARQIATNSDITDSTVKTTAGDVHDSGPLNSLYDPHLHTAFSKIGVALPDSMVSHFDGEWCLRLQNFANAPGYISVYLGGVPCGSSISSNAAAIMRSSPPPFPQQPSTLAAAATTPATAVLQWNSEAAFSLDCGYKTPVVVSENDAENTGEEEQSDNFYSGVGAMIHAAAVKASSEFAAALQPKTMECSVAVSVSGGGSGSASPGSGAVLQSSQTFPVFTSHRLNALKLRVCNLPVQSVTSAPAAATLGQGGSIHVHGLKVNNRHLAVESLQEHPSNECHVALLRLPTRALADGFVLNGYMTLEKDGNTVGSTGMYNVGEMASVEMQIGSLRLLSNSLNEVEGAAGEEVPQLPPAPPAVP